MYFFCIKRKNYPKNLTATLVLTPFNPFLIEVLSQNNYYTS